MESPETFIAFGAVMLVVALLGVAIDWFGKPLRHRRFVPKIYRFPEERQPKRSKVRETPWSDTSFVLPVVDQPPDQPIRYPDPHAAAGRFGEPPHQQVPAPELLAADGGEPTMPVEVVTMEDRLETDAPEVLPINRPTSTPPQRTSGWRPGENVFNLTKTGAGPSTTTIRRRFWRNVAITSGAAMFGDDNVNRMQAGDPPTRRNPRTGRVESMRLPRATYEQADGETPVPEWPDPEPDPFAMELP